MALSGLVTTTSSHGRSLTLTWTATQDSLTNKSTISWSVKGSGSAGGWVYVNEVRITINGKQAFYRNSSSTHTQCYVGTQVCSGTTQILHNTDGTKSFTVKVEAGIYNHVINCSGKATFTLNTIALASSIATASDTTLGNNCQITWTPATAVYTYKLQFSLGEWSYTTGVISPAQTTQYTYSGYQIPIDGVAQQIPKAKTDTMTVFLYTYSDNAATKQIGSVATKTFTVTVPNTLRPTLTSVTTTVDNSGNSKVQQWGIALSKVSKVRVCAEASADGTYGSSIASYTISGGYNEVIESSSNSLDYTGNVISESGEITFTVVVTDSRGYSSEPIIASPSINFQSYSEPSILSFSAQRTYSVTSEGRTTITVKGNWQYDSVNDNDNKPVTAVLIYKRNGSNGSSWIRYGDITQQINTSIPIEYPSGGSADVGFPETSAYDFRLVVTDALGKMAISQVLVPTAEVLLDFKAGGKGLGIGRVAESDRLEVGLETIFMKTAKILDYGVEKTLESYIYEIIDSVTTPHVLVQPTNRTINLGDEITLSLRARGVGLTYQWYFKKVGQTNFNVWNGRTGSSETVTPNATWDGIQLYCAITGSSGNTTNSDIITITVNQ